MCIRDSNYTMRQLKLPLEIEKLIDISDPVYTFCEVMDHIDLSRYFVEKATKQVVQDVMFKNFLKLYFLHLWKTASVLYERLKSSVIMSFATCIFSMA